MKQFKNTTFKEGYNPSFLEFKKAHGHVISSQDMEAAYKVVSGKDLTKKQKDDLKKDIDGNTSATAGKSKEVKSRTSN